MLAIVNISEFYSSSGRQLYEVRVNRIPLWQFWHEAEEGMAQCIKKAWESAPSQTEISQSIEDYHNSRLRGIQEALYGEFGEETWERTHSGVVEASPGKEAGSKQTGPEGREEADQGGEG